MTRSTTRGGIGTFTAAHPQLVDGLQAVAFATCGLLLTATAYAAAPQQSGRAERYPEPWQVALVAVVVYAPLALRRRTPLTTLALVSLGLGLHTHWMVPESIFVSLSLFPRDLLGE